MENNGLFGLSWLRNEGPFDLENLVSLKDWNSECGPVWIDMDRDSDIAEKWLYQISGLDPIVCDALLAEDTRPRRELFDDGVMIILRGVNLTGEEDAGEMISLRMWFDSNRVITIRRYEFQSLNLVRQSIQSSRGPKTTSDFLINLVEKICDLTEPVLDDLNETIDQLGDRILNEDLDGLKNDIVASRRKASALKRYLAPQRETISRLCADPLTWMSDRHFAQLRESVDRIKRYTEDLDLNSNHAGIAQEQLINLHNERTNKAMYILSVVAAIFLPLSFITGLLGINVGGIPGAENPLGFLIVITVLAGITSLELMIFRLMKFL